MENRALRNLAGMDDAVEGQLLAVVDPGGE